MNMNGIAQTAMVSGYAHAKPQKYQKKETPDFLQNIEEQAADTVRKKDCDAEAFDRVGPNAPESVRKAWMEAAKEVGANGLGVKSDGMMSHISQMMVQRLTNQLQGKTNPDDILGSSVQSAISAVTKAIYSLDNPLPGNVQSIEVQRYKLQERQFYQTFLNKLQHLN